MNIEEYKNPMGASIESIHKMASKTPRLTVRNDEAARRRIADTDGTLRRMRQVAEENRLI